MEMRSTMRNAICVIAMVISSINCSPSWRMTPGRDVAVERLYFGRNIRDSAFVSDSSWSVFLSEIVTPRFPNGFTVLNGEGQWKAEDGRIIQEKTFIIEKVHEISPAWDAAIQQIIAEYKKRFRQESVLRVTSLANASY